MSHVRRSYIAMEKADKKLRQPPKEFFELVDAVAGGRKDEQHDRSEELVKKKREPSEHDSLKDP